jgi:hypothetical protein
MKIEFDKIVKGVEKFKNSIFKENVMAVGTTHPIWEQLKQHLNGEISTKSLYTIVKCNRNGILNKLNITLNKDSVLDNISENEEDHEIIQNYIQT